MTTRAPKPATPTPSQAPATPLPTAMEEVDLLRLQVARLRLADNENTLKELVRQHTEAMKARETNAARLDALSVELRERYALADATVDVETGAITRG